MHDFLRRALPAVQGVKVRKSMLVPRVLRGMHVWTPRPEDFWDGVRPGR